MLKTIVLATLATAAVSNGSAIQFTKDSVYKNNNILSCEVVEISNINEETGEENISKQLILKENRMLGYTIYDNPNTAYIDGLKVDDEFVTDWVVNNYDESIEHSIKIKTVYTDDAAGILMAAKDGDWSKLLSNPIIVIQGLYYLLAAGSLIAGLVIAGKSKKKTSKTVNEYGTELNKVFNNRVASLSTNLEDSLVNLVSTLTLPMYEEIQAQNKDLLSALILSQSGDEKSKLAMIDLLKTSASKDIKLLSEEIKEKIKSANLTASLMKTNAENTIKEIAKGTFNTEPKQGEVDDGTSI